MININHFDIEGETTAASTIAAAETAAKEDKPEGFQPFAWATDVLGVKDPHNKAQLAVVANERGYKISRKKKAENIIKDMHEQYEAEVKEQQAVHELPPFIPGEQTFTVNNGGAPGIAAPAPEKIEIELLDAILRQAVFKLRVAGRLYNISISLDEGHTTFGTIGTVQ